MAYHKFKSEDGSEYGSFEVFHSNDYLKEPGDIWYGGPGWYWWPCFPGCLPDGEAYGPFATEQEAIDDARKG